LSAPEGETKMKDPINRMVLVIALAVVFSLVIVPKARAEDGCTLDTLKGTWGFVFNGTIIGFGPIAVVGVATFDGEGHFSRDERAVVNGNVLPREFITGTYTVSGNCTGTTADTLGNSSEFVIVSNRKEIISIGTHPGTVSTITLKKQ
jgi:hypothetical protein